jgi:L-rhamnose isomerase/sugar isomerase
LFLVFNELIEAEHSNPRDGFDPAYMIDQSHNVTDPIESMLSSAEAIVGALPRPAGRPRGAGRAQANDTMMAFQALRRAYRTDVSPMVAMARIEAGGAIDRSAPIATAAGAIARPRSARRSAWERGSSDERKRLISGDLPGKRPSRILTGLTGNACRRAR